MNAMDRWEVPLLVVEAAGEVRGKTRMQKLVYLIQDRMERHWFAYQNYLHGPFSVELSRAIDELKSARCLEEKVTTTPAGYELHVYSMTNEGRALLQALNTLSRNLEEIEPTVRRTVTDYGSMDLKELLTVVYEKAGLPPRD